MYKFEGLRIGSVLNDIQSSLAIMRSKYGLQLRWGQHHEPMQAYFHMWNIAIA